MFKRSKITFTTQLDRKLANDVIRYFYLLLLDLMCLTMQINQSIIHIVRCSVFYRWDIIFTTKQKAWFLKKAQKRKAHSMTDIIFIILWKI